VGIPERVRACFAEVERELYKLGVPIVTRHNEVAPCQFEMAPRFEETDIAVDHNQLVMSILRRVALRHGLQALLHEKPFAGINGSGKHCNWAMSVAADNDLDGVNLLKPGKTPHQNLRFLMFLAAVLNAVHRHAGLLRAAIASSGNEHRLGANEAPPAIVSIFMGDELTDILEKLSKGQKAVSRGKEFVTVGVDTLPVLPKDNTDRNRTSPFAFTGNKFEFRMVGSSASIAGPNVAINTIVAEVLDEIATRLEKAKNKKAEVQAIIREFVSKHRRIIFNGNNYAEEWVTDAKKRGLPNVTNTVDALKAYTTTSAKALFEKYNVLSRDELHSRYEIYVETYAKEINIEALTAIQMVRRQYLPAAIEFATDLAGSISAIESAGTGSSRVQADMLGTVSKLIESAYAKLGKLETATAKSHATADVTKRGEAYRDRVFSALGDLRTDIDALEGLVPTTLWPVPTYADLLYMI
jgi:glutamine synthetase